MKPNIYTIIHGLLFILFLIPALCFGRMMYLLYAVLCLAFIVYFKKHETNAGKNFAASIILLLFAFPVFSVVSGMVSYRPKHSLFFYKQTLLDNNDIFSETSDSKLKLTDFDIFMEGHRGQEIILSFSASEEDINAKEAYYQGKAIAESGVYDSVKYSSQSYEFVPRKYLKGNAGNYRIYYTDLQDEHQSGIAVNKTEKIIVFFDT